jgi:hypothetical protein
MSQEGDNTDVTENNGGGDVDDRQQQIAPPTQDDVDESHLPPYKRSRRNVSAVFVCPFFFVF